MREISELIGNYRGGSLQSGAHGGGGRVLARMEGNRLFNRLHLYN